MVEYPERMRLRLIVLERTFAVCRLEPDAELPEWSVSSGFFSITRTGDELSIVCSEAADIPEDVRCERGWRMMRIAGTQAFTATGVLNAILSPLAAAKIGIFSISTFDTDYILVKAAALESAVEALRSAGHDIERKTEQK